MSGVRFLSSAFPFRTSIVCLYMHIYHNVQTYADEHHVIATSKSSVAQSRRGVAFPRFGAVVHQCVSAVNSVLYLLVCV